MNCACGISSAFEISGTLSLSHSVYDLNRLRDLPDVRHPFLYCSFFSLNCTCVVSTAYPDFPGCLGPGNGRCHLHSWSVSHSDEMPEPESEASPLFAVMLGLPELVCMIIVTSYTFSVNWTSGICLCFLNSQQRHRPS